MAGTVLSWWVWATATYGVWLTLVLAFYVVLLTAAFGWLFRTVFLALRQWHRRRRVGRELEASRAEQYSRRFMEATHGRGRRA